MTHSVDPATSGDYAKDALRARTLARMKAEGIPQGTDDPTLLALGAKPLYPCTVGECLTLGGHDGSPCSFCGHKTMPRPPAIPKKALERERAKHPDRSSHFGGPS